MKRLLCIIAFAALLPIAARAAFYEVESSGPCQPGMAEPTWFRWDVWEDGGTPGLWEDDRWWFSYGIDCNGKYWENGTPPPGFIWSSAQSTEEREARIRIQLQDKDSPVRPMRGRIATPEKINGEAARPGENLH